MNFHRGVAAGRGDTNRVLSMPFFQDWRLPQSWVTFLPGPDLPYLGSYTRLAKLPHLQINFPNISVHFL